MESSAIWKTAKTIILLILYVLIIVFSLKVALASGWNTSYINSKDYNVENVNPLVFNQIRLMNLSTTERSRFLANTLDAVWTNSTNSSILNYDLEEGTNNSANTIWWLKT